MILWAVGTAIAVAAVLWFFYEMKNAPTVVDDTTLYAKASKAEVKEKDGQEDN